MAVTIVYNDLLQRIEGGYIHRATLEVTGLTAGAANTIPHGLPTTPEDLPIYQATTGTPGFQTAAPDGTNLYYTSGVGQTSVEIGVEYH